MSIDIMKQALEALEYHVEQTRPIHRTSEAIAALRAAIKQAERPPGWWVDGLTATLMREGINKHRAREIAQGYWEAYCEVSDEH